MKIGKWGETSWGETSHLYKFWKKVGRNDFWGETSQGEMLRGETSLGEKRLSSSNELRKPLSVPEKNPLGLSHPRQICLHHSLFEICRIWLDLCLAGLDKIPVYLKK